MSELVHPRLGTFAGQVRLNGQQSTNFSLIAELGGDLTQSVIAERVLRRIRSRLSARQVQPESLAVHVGAQPGKTNSRRDMSRAVEARGSGITIAAHRLDARTGDVAGDHELRPAALCPQLVALVEEPFGLLHLSAALVQQLSQ